MIKQNLSAIFLFLLIILFGLQWYSLDKKDR